MVFGRIEVVILTLNKSFVTNFIAMAITVTGYFSSNNSELLLTVGLFALSGSLTNWLAIHMLFDKVPFLYGSGVIPSQFEEFKTGIKHLLICEFFTRENVESFIDQGGGELALGIKDKIDFNHVYNGLVEAIEASSIGGMIGMFGGRKALEPLKEPMIVKLEEIILELLETEKKNDDGGKNTSGWNGFTKKCFRMICTFFFRFCHSILYCDTVASPGQSRCSQSTYIHRPTHQVPCPRVRKVLGHHVFKNEVFRKP